MLMASTPVRILGPGTGRYSSECSDGKGAAPGWAALAILDNAPDPQDARLRLRSALRHIISDIWLLIVPRGRARLAAVQVWFTDGKRRRDYLLFHRPARANASARTDEQWWARSLAAVAEPGDLDLRNRDHAARLEAALLALDLGSLR